jgi:hypothetical protein
MPKITAYKCPFTNKLFDTRRKYRNHLLKLRKQKAEQRARRKVARIAKQIRDEKLERIHSALAGVRTIKELEQAFIDLYGEMMEYHAKRKGYRMVAFDLFSIRYSNRVSNTHSCPRGGVQNFSCDDDKPRGYPGFTGRIEYTVIEPKHTDPFWHVSDAVSYFGVKTGTGGGRGDCPETGGKRYYYDVKIFLDDFPGLASHVEELHEEHKKLIFKKKLKGERVQDPVYDSVIG